MRSLILTAPRRRLNPKLVMIVASAMAAWVIAAGFWIGAVEIARLAVGAS